jgi:hypothetical protein
VLHIVGSDVDLQRNNAKGTNCCACMAALSLLKTLTPTIQRERIVTLTWQLWLRERPTILHYTYIAYCVEGKISPCNLH